MKDWSAAMSDFSMTTQNSQNKEPVWSVSDVNRAMREMVENGFVEAKPTKKTSEPQMNATMSFEDMSIYEAADRIKKTDINTLTPIEAMNFIFELKKLLN